MTTSGLHWCAGRTVAVSPDDREVWLFGGEGPVRLAGVGAGPLARSIDGHRTAPEVVENAVSEGMARDAAERILDKWRTSGHVVDQVKAQATPVRVRLVDSPPEFAEALHSAGIELVPDNAEATVIVLDDLLALAALDPDDAVPVIVVQLRGAQALVTTPLGSGAGCASCIAQRISVRRSMELVAARRSGRDLPPPSAILHPSATALAAGVVAAQLELPQAGDPGVYVITPALATVERHQVVRVPGCPSCDPSGTSLVNSHLSSDSESDPGSLVDGAGLVGFRTRDPEETWLEHAHHVSSVVGVVPVVEPMGPIAMRTYVAGANVVGVDDPTIAASLFRNRGGGKGLTLSAARASALAEALERDALRARRDEPHRIARFADLDGAIHPHTVQLFSEAQMQLAAAAWLTGASPQDKSHIVPAPFPVDREVAWSPVRSLVTGELHWLPSSMLYVGWEGRGTAMPPACSNGVAAGNTIAEAQLQGMLELVERDAVALWWYPRSLRKRFDLQAWDDPRVHAAAAPHLAAGSQVDVIDVTTDLGIPAAVALVRDAHSGMILTGAGAHTDSAIAVARALTEAAQMVAALSDADVDDPRFQAYLESAWDRHLTDADRQWVFGQGIAEIPDTPTYTSVAEARDDVVARIRARGHDVLWADMTRRDVDLPVVRTFAPGLRHFWRRLAPGRLYDVPVAQGWVSEPFDEQSVNTWEMPI